MPLPLMAALAIGQGVMSIGGMIGAGKARKKQRKMLARQKAESKAMYNEDYHKDFFDTNQARSALSTVRKRLKKSNKTVNNTAAITGATPEAVTNAKSKNHEQYAETVNRLAGYATQHKDNVRRAYLRSKQSYDGAELTMQGQEVDSWSNFAGNALGGVSSSLMGLAGGGGKVGDPKGFLNSSNMPKSEVVQDVWT